MGAGASRSSGSEGHGLAELSDFEGREVVAVGVEMPNASGGLQKALDIDPEELHHGEKGHIVLAFTVQKVRFDPMSKNSTDVLRRVHVFHVDEAAFIDSELVSEVLDEQRERIRKAEEEATGQTNLLDGEPVGPDPDEPPGDPESEAQEPETEPEAVSAPLGADDEDEVVTDDSASDEDADVPPYDKWKKSELVEEIQARNESEERTAETRISTQGSKDDLVARLEADDAGPAPSPAE